MKRRASQRPSVALPVLFGTASIVFTIAILVGWNIMFTRFYVVATEAAAVDLGVGYWFLLSLGCVFLMAIVATLVVFLVQNIRKTLQMRQQTAFIDSVTHELRSPLASLVLGLDTMERRELSPELRERFLRTMRADVDRLREFIEHVIEAGRLEHSERELDYRPIDLRELAERCAARISRRHTVPEGSITIDDGALEADARTVISDAVAVETVVLNLLDNAVKYSGDTIEVRLALRRVEGHIELTVTDRGVGIARPQLRKVFQRFHRVERPSARPVRGTGLGLYVVATLVERLGGDIVARSPGETRGSTFVVTLPAAPAIRARA